MSDNTDLAIRLMRSLETDRKFWFENMSDDIKLEFPYAKSVGMPSHVAGRENVEAYLNGVFAMVAGLRFREMTAYAMADSDMVLLTYKGLSDPPGRPVYDQDYVTIMRFKSGRIVLFREYWDTTIVRDALGDVIAKMG